MITWFLLALAISTHAAEPPFYTREVKDLRDVGALNENSRALADGIRKSDLTNGGIVDGDLTPDRLCFPDGTCQTAASGGLASTQTWSGANTFTSSFTFNTGTSGGGASTRVSGTIARSTQIVTSSNQTAGTVAWACYSTITFMSNGGTWVVSFTGTATGGAADAVHTGFLIDGLVPSPWTATKGIVYVQVSVEKNTGFTVMVPNIAAGARSVCAAFWRDTGSTATLQCGDRNTCTLNVVEL